MGMGTFRLSLRLQESSTPCEILIQEGLLRKTRACIEPLLEDIPSSVVIITDSNVGKQYGEQVRHDFSKIARTNILSFKAGENSKTLQSAAILLSKLASLDLDRKGVIISLGGGVVGDLAGFVASVFKRGITFFQIPTTLLAQVDSSIGGKTGVDAKWGKNQIGAFYHPRGVLIDPLALKSLPETELINGVGEIIKYSVIANKKMFDRLSRSRLDSGEDLGKFIPECCAIKVSIVSKDPMERNLRSILNYGHTLGHAVEAASDYSLSHGKSVIMGMLAEGWIARELGFFEKDDYERQQAMLLGLDLSPDHLNLDEKKLLALALADKKSSSGVIRMSLPEKIGKMHITKDWSYRIPVPAKLFSRSLRYLRNVT